MAAGGDSSVAFTALEELCGAYWYPLYAHVRRKGHSPPDAQDLTQGFFASLLERQSLRQVNPAKGKFRSFLLASLDHFIANEWRRQSALKRGRGCTTFSLDGVKAEERYRFEPSDGCSPDRLFERRWALTLLERALSGLERECAAAHRADLFQALKGMLSGTPCDQSYAEIAGSLGMTEAGVKKAAQRLRDRYRDLLRQEVGETVSEPGEVDEELRYLCRALQ